jgi:hypothetical protein
MKIDKRKEISPLNDGRNYPSVEASHMSKRYKAGENSSSYANIAASKTSVSATDNGRMGNRPTRIVGKSTFTNLKAAAKDSSPSITFCISNISLDYSVDDMRRHCASLGVRVRFIYDISKVSLGARAFKLAVGVNDSATIQDGNSWPEGVSIRSWRPFNRFDSSSRPGYSIVAPADNRPFDSNLDNRYDECHFNSASNVVMSHDEVITDDADACAASVSDNNIQLQDNSGTVSDIISTQRKETVVAPTSETADNSNVISVSANIADVQLMSDLSVSSRIAETFNILNG